MIIYMKDNYIHRHNGKPSIAPGERFDPAGIVEPTTLKRWLMSGAAVEEKDPEAIAQATAVDVVAVEVVDEPKAIEAPEVSETVEEVVSDADKLKEHCVLDMADIKNLKRAELDALVDMVFEEAGVDKGDTDFPNIETVLGFLTGRLSLEDL